LTINPTFPDTSCNKLVVLRTKVNNQYHFSPSIKDLKVLLEAASILYRVSSQFANIEALAGKYTAVLFSGPAGVNAVLVEKQLCKVVCENSFYMLETATNVNSIYFLTDTLILNDTGPANEEQPVNGFIGITGLSWDIATQLVLASSIPVIPAGGISPENVTEGIRHVHPAGVDSCTGSNAIDIRGQSVRFKKDPEKVKEIVRAVRNAEIPIRAGGL